MSQDSKKIKIIGVGGGGSNVVCRMVENTNINANYFTFNVFDSLLINEHRRLGIQPLFLRNVFAPTGALDLNERDFEYYFSDPTERNDVIQTIFSDELKHLIIIAGMGGGWCFVASMWLVKHAKKHNIPVTIVCSLPFKFEGVYKEERALNAIRELKNTDARVCPINPQVLVDEYRDLNLLNCFEKLDKCMAENVKEIYSVVERS